MTNNAKLFELLQQRAAANLAKELNKDEKKVETPLNLSKTTETKEATQTVEEVTNKEVAKETTETKEATQTAKEEVVETKETTETVEEEVTTETVEEEVTTETVEEESTETDSTTGTTEDAKPKNSNAALMALMAQRQTSNTGKGRSNSNTSNNKKEKEVFMYEHVSEVESIIYFNGDEVGRIPKQALIPDANYPKFIRETIIPHIKQASMDQFRFRPQGADWYLEPNPVYAEKFHKQG